MPATQSKVRNGTLTLDGTLAVHTQARNVEIKGKTSGADDPVELVSAELLAGDAKREYTLNFKMIQDFDDPNGVIAFAWENEGEVVPVTWKPNPAGPTWAGNVVVEIIDSGGDAGKRVESDVSWKFTAKPTLTYI